MTQQLRCGLGSKTFEGVWFQSFSHDHFPAHVHGSYAEVAVIVELLADGTVRESTRKDAVAPSNAKRSDVKRILAVASKHGAALRELWEKTHGTTSA
jgi:hypothetical protein